MGLFSAIKRIFTRNALAVTDEKAWNPALWHLTGGKSVAGEHVDEYSALTYAAVWNAVLLISGTVASLPLHLMVRKGKGKELADNKRLYHVMHTAANPYMTAMAVRECLMAHILTWGNGFCEIVRDGYGNVVELWPITPNRVRIEMADGELAYVIRVDNKEVVLPREKVLHVPGLGFDGFQGYSVIAMARGSIGLGKALESFGGLYFSQGTHPGVIVSHPGKLSEQASVNLQSSLTAAYSGIGKSHRLMLLEEGMKLEKLGIPPNDSQFLESRQYQIPEIARWFNLPPHKLKDLTRSSFNNIESEQISFVTDSILPWLVRLEQNFNLQLLNEGERRLGRLYFKHIVEGLLRGSAKDRAEYYRVMFSIGSMSVNEIRDKEDFDPVEGGDIHLVPLNMTSLEHAGEQPEDGSRQDPVIPAAPAERAAVTNPGSLTEHMRPRIAGGAKR